MRLWSALASKMQIIMGDFVHRRGGGVRGANCVTHSVMHILTHTHRYRDNTRDVSHGNKLNIQHRNKGSFFPDSLWGAKVCSKAHFLDE